MGLKLLNLYLLSQENDFKKFLDGLKKDFFEAEEIKREDVKIDYNEKESSVYMDFTHGYDVDAVHTTLQKAERKFTLTDDKIDLYDKFAFSEKPLIVERFVTTIKPRIEGNSVILDDVRFTCTSDATLNIVEQPYVDQLPDENGNYNKICFLLDYTLNGDTLDFSATIDFLG